MTSGRNDGLRRSNAGHARVLILFFGIFTFSSCLGESATGADAPQPAKEPSHAKPESMQTALPSFGFSGPEIVKLDWGVAGLLATDVNGDGRTDLVMINNRSSRIDFLMARDNRNAPAPASGPQEDVNRLPEHSAFTRSFYLVDRKILGLAVADFNGDKLPDLVFHTIANEAQLVLQQKDGGWEKSSEFKLDDQKPFCAGMEAIDLGGDGRMDVVLMTAQSLLLFRQNESGQLIGPESLPLGTDKAFRLALGDINGDGMTDLLYTVADDSHPLKFRLAGPGGIIGPEIGFKTAPLAYICCRDIDGDGTSEVFTIQAESGRVLLLKLGKAAESKETAGYRVQVLNYPLESDREADDRSAVVGDLDGDGLADIAVSRPSVAKVDTLIQRDGKLAPAEAYPTLVKVRNLEMADLNGDGRNELLAVSKEEEAIGASGMTPEGRMSFPKALPLQGKPQCFTIGDINGDGRSDMIYAYEGNPLVTGDGEAGKSTDATKATRIAVCLGAAESELRPAHEIPFDGKNVPSALKLCDPDRNGKPDLLIFTRFDPPRLMIQLEDGSFEDASARKRFRMGMLKDVPPEGVSAGDVDGDGKNEMLISAGNLARAFALEPSGEMRVVDQFAGRSAFSVVSAAEVSDLDDEKGLEIVLMDTKDNTISILRRNKKDVYEIVHNIAAGKMDFRGMRIADLNGDGRKDICLLGKDCVRVVYLSAPELRFEELAMHETDIEGGRYSAIEVGDLNADGRKDALLIEYEKRHLAILDYQPSSGLRQACNFMVFEEKSFQAGQPSPREPREILAADVTGDGRDDIVILVHDRLIYYPQEATDEASRP
ncbi:MAG TPA: VCBS repeat-containing protein [Candidatus Brocadiia bacterium]|nr:VCBS repeat-containing protein [Candidatus Brocadiia bacterium]